MSHLNRARVNEPSVERMCESSPGLSTGVEHSAAGEFVDAEHRRDFVYRRRGFGSAWLGAAVQPVINDHAESKSAKNDRSNMSQDSNRQRLIVCPDETR